jgi:hypothetical protein
MLFLAFGIRGLGMDAFSVFQGTVFLCAFAQLNIFSVRMRSPFDWLDLFIQLLGALAHVWGHSPMEDRGVNQACFLSR